MRLNKELFQSYKTYPEKIVQFGEGNFLRGFVDWQVQKMNERADFNGSVVVVQPLENGMVQMLNNQDCLYTLYLQGMKKGEAVREHEVINSISRGLNPYKEYEQYLKIAEQSEIRFVISNTTEAGIAFDENDKLEDKPQNTYPAKLTAFLYHRFKFFNGNKEKGLIIIPCELIDRNGEKLKEMVYKYVDLWNLESEFINWLDEANIFCCSLVDRIVPGYPRDEISKITEELGYEDNLVDVGEQFYLWIIEGPKEIEREFPVGKARLNIKFVDDMTPYRTRKVRILNGAHTSLVPVAYLCGLDTVKDSVEDNLVGQYLREIIFDEIIPTLDLPEDELKEFANDVLERFRNPFIKHYLMSIALNSMSKFETRDLPSLLEYLDRKGTLPNKLCFSLAALIEFYKGKRGDEDIALKDGQDVLGFYESLWSKYDGNDNSLRDIVINVLGYKAIWKRDLNEIPGLTDKVSDYLIDIENLGIKNAVRKVMNK